MRRKDIKLKLKNEVEASVPDILGSILETVENDKNNDKINDNDIKTIKNKKNKIINFRMISAAAAVFIVVVTVFLYKSYNSVGAVIDIDVNPSIEIKINKSEKVLSVNILNNEAVDAIDSSKLKNKTLNEVVEIIIDTMTEKGYISNNKNSLLLSVDNKKSKTDLGSRLETFIESKLSDKNLEGAIISQSLTEDLRLKKLADENNISVGKAKIIDYLIKQDSLLVFSEVAKLSINDIKAMSEDKKTEMPDVKASGNANRNDYLSKDKIKSIVINHTKLSMGAVGNMEINLDCDDGKMIYEAEFIYNGYEYEYELDAKTGAVLETDKESVDDGEKSKSKNNSHPHNEEDDDNDDDAFDD